MRTRRSPVSSGTCTRRDRESVGGSRLSSAKRRGQFIAIEGIDGAGKTTLTRRLDDIFKDDPRVVTYRKQHIGEGSEYLRRHMAELRKLIWDHPADDPYYELDPMHAVFLHMSWLTAIDRCWIGPLIDAGTHVVIDNWTYKLLARIHVNHPEVYDRARRLLGELRTPDLVIRLQVPAEIALDRKRAITAAEAGVVRPVRRETRNALSSSRTVSTRSSSASVRRTAGRTSTRLAPSTESRSRRLRSSLGTS